MHTVIKTCYRETEYVWVDAKHKCIDATKKWVDANHYVSTHTELVLTFENKMWYVLMHKCMHQCIKVFVSMHKFMRQCIKFFVSMHKCMRQCIKVFVSMHKCMYQYIKVYFLKQFPFFYIIFIFLYIFIVIHYSIWV